jgi:hypothetical protein
MCEPARRLTLRSVVVGHAARIARPRYIRVTCDACGVSMADVCGKPDLPVMVRVAAIRKFKTAGWHHDPGTHARTKTLEEVQFQRDGTGKWYCPTCGRKGHL